MSAKALAELRALRAGGKKRSETWKPEEEVEPIYDEVDEEAYKKIVRQRLNEDDFVVDDNGEGYADDGREDWQADREPLYNYSSEEELPVRGKAAKRKREEDEEKQQKITNGISKYFNNTAPKVAAKPKPVVTADDEAFLAGLLNDVDTNLPTRRPEPRPVKSQARRKVRVLSPPISENRHASKTKEEGRTDPSLLNDTFTAEPQMDIDDVVFPDLDDDTPMSDVLPSSPVTKHVERKTHPAVKKEEDEEDEDMLMIAEAVGQEGLATTSVNMAGSRPAPKIKKPSVYPSPEGSSPTRAPPVEVDASSWNDVTQKLNVLSSPAPAARSFGKMKAEDALEEDGSLQMFWFDYTEVNGSLCLFGKVKNKKTGSYESAFVKIDNILRKLYFLPREYRQKHGRDTDEEVMMKDVYEEVDALMTNLRVNMHKIKSCSRKYAFELVDIPKEADYLKLLYPYDKQALPTDLRGETFSHIFGTNTALFEQFVLWKNIMGPCWLRIEEANFSAITNSSWCKLELQVSKPSLITIMGDSDHLDAPPLTLMSISLRTKLNVKENKQEILLASARVYDGVSLNDKTPTEQLPCRTFTIMRPIEHQYPMGFEVEAKKHRGTLMLEKSEQFLLSKFLAMLDRADPDVLIGHQFQEVDYSVLLSRMRERRTPGWHRIGRMKRSDWPKNFGKGGSSWFTERQLVAGRLMCDLANDMGKSMMSKCNSWSLTEMCQLYLHDDHTRRDIDNEAALKTWATSRDGLMNYVNHCEADTFFIAALARKIQMLPLTKQLTNLAGNSWARTLSGTRAERNEYILLHEFHRNKYICPDKSYGRGKQKVEEDLPDGDVAVDVKKKDKYKGGLVFEPEKGLYDKYILVMDFNSLYPSIIQEFNICFTTVDRSETSENENEEKVPEVPIDQPQGILPKLIKTLVSRRREVKKLMKDRTATPDQIATWDIKQMALKLTANSMYGCLGYTQSRFYARPLAMLTTFKGREILRSTKELAESNQLHVVYGDTDSVMVNSNAKTLEEALKIGNEFKKLVNDRYRLLEIDIDNVFRRLLLHAKKKYAAINMTEVNGKYIEKLEVKGLDMKRREYCALSKEVSSTLLNEILSGEEQEVAIGRIHEYLCDLSQKMRENTIPVQKYIIYTKLGKNPKEYPNPDSMPQVQVALRELARGKNPRANDVMAFIITGDSKNTTTPAPKRAYSPQDVLAPSSDLHPDVEYYLLKQIFPPIERLCAPIAGTDSVRLAECLGLDTRKYQINTAGTTNQNADIHPLESQIPDEIRFKDAARLSLTCRHCHTSTPFEGLATTPDMVSPQGLICSNPTCKTPISILSTIAQLEHQIRIQTARYYEGWLICDDPSCGARTRQMSVYGHRCLGPKGLASGCLGRMQYEYSEKALYSQLLYYAGLWDVDKAKECVARKAALSGEGKVEEEKRERREKVEALAEWNRERFGKVKGVVDGYLGKCGRQWVAMDSLFGFAMK
ncbi:MAG: DNA-directed DNA polymerase alpha catalytic subunit pol1 [Cirrosporium novae-zelandiae]|nr:MAG: DNA-directed DNA polymerase alpha catalytic subunit pol1 [Cirrosporium novae-zelandiae]